jgi:predicted nuclease of restriction endonuclease-like (RecB) superfamily
MKRRISAVETETSTHDLVFEIKGLIDSSRQLVAQAVNSTMTMLYWKIGQRINNEILQHQRAEYGKYVIPMLSEELVGIYGGGFAEKNLRRMMQFAEVFPHQEIVVSAIRQLSWTHFVALLPIKEPLERVFYAEMCRLESWSVKTLRNKITSMLYERTAISKKPEETIRRDLEQLRMHNVLDPELVFRDRYFLEFLGLEDSYSEKTFEAAILKHLERFIKEIGKGFLFMDRQKRLIIDGEDHYLDLLFYHRRLKRLIAIDLKLGKFKAEYKSKMELYLRWLELNEMQEDEETPIGLILCAEGNEEQIEMLQLDKSGIKVANYVTELPDLKALRTKLLRAITLSREKFKSEGKKTKQKA